MTLRTFSHAAAAAALLASGPALAAQHADVLACGPLGDALVEERLPQRWIPAREVLAELVRMGEPAVCRAALDVITPAGISDLGVWEGTCLEALREVDDMATEAPDAAALALGRVAVAAGTGEDCAAALEG